MRRGRWCRLARSGLERITELTAKVEPGDRHREHGAQEDGGDQGYQRQTRVKCDAAPQGQAIGAEHAQQANPASANGETQETSGEGERRGLDNRFGNNMPSAGTQRPPNRQLLHPATRADQKKVDQVHGADQQKDERARLQQQQSGPNRGNVIGLQRHDHGTESGIGDHFGLWVVHFQGGILRVELRLGLQERGIRFKAGNHLDDVSTRMALRGHAIRRKRRQGKVQPGLGRKESEAGRHDADHGRGDAIRTNLRADDVGIGVGSVGANMRQKGSRRHRPDKRFRLP